VKHNSNQGRILNQAVLFIDEDKELEFDTLRPTYFVFNNVAFDMTTGLEVTISKYDYITQSTHYDYVEPTQEKVIEIKKLIKEILPDEDYRNCYLSVLKSCCVGIRQEKFILANGGGRNGKGIISQLMKYMLGEDYFYQGNCSTLTQQIKSGANPEIANMDNKRAIMFSEPEENAGLFLGVIKALTGEDTTNARGLYSSKTKTKLVPTIILEVNGKPNINGKINDSAIERWININFPNLYTDNDDLVDNVTIFKQNTLYKEHDWRMNSKCALFKVLLEVSENKIIIPKSVRMDTLNYLLNNDSLLKWFNQEYKIVNENGNEHIAKICDLYNHFKEGEFYMNLSKKQKRDEYSKKGFIEKVKENVKLKAYFHEDKIIGGIHYRNILTHCCKMDIEENENEDIY
jgi:phage/plasmid-associated DNA primase